MSLVSKNFSFEEFVVSSSYPQIAVTIEMTELDKYKIFWMCYLFLQSIRDIVEKPVVILSALRRGELNRLVGGVSNSDHLFRDFSCAVDFLIGSAEENMTRFYLGSVDDICKRNQNFFKQRIYYYPSDKGGNFIHLSLRDKTDKVGERLYCVAREQRIYFHFQQEAEDYLLSVVG